MESKSSTIEQLTEAEKTCIQTVYRGFLKRINAKNSRPQQRQMIGESAKHFTQITRGFIQAPTGTGKSAAYLIPGLVLAAMRGKKLIVSTATAALQDQLSNIDMPNVLKACADAGIHGLSHVVAKGRERHMCVTKLHAVADQGGLFTDSEEVKQIELITNAWENNTWDGIRDSFPFQVPNLLWAKVNNMRETCTGRSCEYIDSCPYYLGVDAMESATVIIANHDYLLSTLLNNPKSKLSDYENNLYVFDEAHHLADKCLKAFSKTIPLGTDWLDKILPTMDLMGHGTGQMASVIARAKDCALALSEGSKAILGEKLHARFKFGEVPDAFMIEVNRYLASVYEIYTLFADAFTDYKERAGTTARNVFVRMRIGAVMGELFNIKVSLEAFVDTEYEKARWIAKKYDNLQLLCSPFDASYLARRYLWSKIKGCVLTSATLGNIESAARALGLSNLIDRMQLNSPLDYSNAHFVVPTFAPAGATSGHNALSEAFIKRDAFNGEARGVLVYFTSRSQMKKVYQSLSVESQAKTLMQGMLTPTQIVANHKMRIDAGEISVIFGLDSFAEGIDLPGQYLTRVIISKIPFPMPDEPILATHCEILARKGKSPFHALMLPLAIVKMAQICGRLVRREGDSGCVIVLDDRMLSKPYGKTLLKATPFTTISRQIEAIARV